MALGGALGPGLGAAVTPLGDAAPLLRGRRGTWWHPPWFHVAGVAQPHIYRRLPSFCVAGVGQMALGGALGPGLGAAVTPVTPRHFCVAGVALGDIHLDFTWQAWHNLTFAWQAWHNLTSTFALRGRRGKTHVHRHFAWQAWHKLTSTVVLRGRRGTHGTGAAQTWQILFLACRLSSCCSCRSVLVQLEVADNSSSTHTSTTELQLVSQGKDAVIGSSLVAQFHKSSVNFLRTTCLACIWLNHNYNESVSEIGHLHAKRRSFRHVSS